MSDHELRVVVVWTFLGLLVGAALTSFNSVDLVRPFVLGALGAITGYVLVIRLRWLRRRR